MATRKIRLTLSGSQVDSIGPIIDVDFNGQSLESDHEVDAITGDSTEAREYTVDAAAGTHNLDITFKNDQNSEISDRNLVIAKLEVAEDGTNYMGVFINEDNSVNIVKPDSGMVSGRIRTDKVTGGDRIPNPNYDPSQPATDEPDDGYVLGAHEGSNPRWEYMDHYIPHKIWTSQTGTIRVTFA
jgi:hypothetical protein